MAYELFCLPEPNTIPEDEEDSSDEGYFEHEEESRNYTEEVSSSTGYATNASSSDAVHDDEDISGESTVVRHTKMSDMWAFGMVVYVGRSLLGLVIQLMPP